MTFTPPVLPMHWLQKTLSNHMHFDALKSTQNVPFDLQKGASLVTATTQSAGIGQGTHTWASRAGNVMMSLYLPRFGQEGAPALSHMTGLLPILCAVCLVWAIRQTGRRLGVDVPMGFKWVNDLGYLESGRFIKVGGLLISPIFAGGVLAGYALGLGLNIAHAPLEGSGALDALMPKTDTDCWYPILTHALLQGVYWHTHAGRAAVSAYVHGLPKSANEVLGCEIDAYHLFYQKRIHHIKNTQITKTKTGRILADGRLALEGAGAVFDGTIRLAQGEL